RRVDDQQAEAFLALLDGKAVSPVNLTQDRRDPALFADCPVQEGKAKSVENTEHSGEQAANARAFGRKTFVALGTDQDFHTTKPERTLDFLLEERLTFWQLQDTQGATGQTRDKFLKSPPGSSPKFLGRSDSILLIF